MWLSRRHSTSRSSHLLLYQPWISLGKLHAHLHHLRRHHVQHHIKLSVVHWLPIWACSPSKCLSCQMSVALHHIDLALKLFIRHSVHLIQVLLDIGLRCVGSRILSLWLWNWCSLLLFFLLDDRFFCLWGLFRFLLLCRFGLLFFWISNDDSSQSFLLLLAFLLRDRC